MSDLTMSARAKLAEPPRLFQIEQTICQMVAKNFASSGRVFEHRNEEECYNIGKRIFNELLDLHLIGLPSGNAARTSVDCSLVAQLGEKLACRNGDDADDVLRTAIRVGVIVG